ncbi:hypothetical protein QNH47_12690 [Virgibacillus halodenitrificans]|uniref:DUF6414 family protein n=1 Tax=Virgibacillus halodenitrificans TaxID=1482 RepID=UPI0024C02A72|nr:hypothetical protein [Virgibacillus halodenitrificans]WHX25024.1 hypothetical protein QNH47_12690 [Virgibacillus halodenitrificans]
MFLPDIYWCNRKKTEQFLGMLVDDLMTEYKLSTKEGRSNRKELGADVGKIVAKYEAGGLRDAEKEGKVVKSTSSLFKDLYTILDGEDKIQKLTGFDSDIWEQLRNGEFIEVEGEFSQSPVELVISSMIDFTNQFKSFFRDETSKDDMTKIELATSMLNLKKITMIINPYVDGEYKFYTSLEAEHFIEDRYDLEGEFTIFGKIRKVYRPHQKIDLIKLLPGKMRMKKEQLMSFIPELDQSDISFDIDEISEDSFEIQGPAIEIMPIAIYQN